jgi:hypothetical protein
MATTSAHLEHPDGLYCRDDVVEPWVKLTDVAAELGWSVRELRDRLDWVYVPLARTTPRGPLYVPAGTAAYFAQTERDHMLDLQCERDEKRGVSCLAVARRKRQLRTARGW